MAAQTGIKLHKKLTCTIYSNREGCYLVMVGETSLSMIVLLIQIHLCIVFIIKLAFCFDIISFKYSKL